VRLGLHDHMTHALMFSFEFLGLVHIQVSLSKGLTKFVVGNETQSLSYFINDDPQVEIIAGRSYHSQNYARLQWLRSYDTIFAIS